MGMMVIVVGGACLGGRKAVIVYSPTRVCINPRSIEGALTLYGQCPTFAKANVGG